MSHMLIVGTTESGKSMLAKDIARRWTRAGGTAFVLDPLLHTWEATEVTADGDRFLALATSHQSCLLVVDEGAETIGRYAGEMRWLATRSRHYGHTAVFVTQRATDVDRTVRDQCRHIAVFAVSAYDVALLVREFPQAGLERAVGLAQHHYFFASRFGGRAVERNILKEKLT